MGLEILFGALALAGTGMQIGGNIAAANAAEDAAKRNAALQNAEADELLSRQALNEKVIEERGDLVQKQYGAAFAATGKGGGGIGGRLEIMKNTQAVIMNTRREAQFRAGQMRAGADIETQLASDRISASYISSAGSLLGLGAKAYGMFRAPTNSVEFNPGNTPGPGSFDTANGPFGGSYSQFSGYGKKGLSLF